MTTLPIELTAAAFGVAGTILLALNGPRAGWGFVAYLVSNAGWIAFAWIHGHQAMLAQQIVFAATSLLGVWVWLVKPRSQTPSTPLMSNAELCEAIRLANELANEEENKPIFGAEFQMPPARQHLEDLMAIQMGRASALMRGMSP